MDILLTCLFAVFCGVSLIGIVLYLPRAKCWLHAFGKQERLFNSKNNRLAVMIPAKNESTSITPLFDSLARQTYDRACFDVYVVVDDELFEDLSGGSTFERFQQSEDPVQVELVLI